MIHKFYIPIVAFFMPMLAVAQGPSSFDNPIQSDSLTELLEAIIDIIILIAVPIIIVAVIYAGFKFVTAGGNANQIAEARRILLWVLVGSLVILGARVIAAAIEGTASELRTT